MRLLAIILLCVMELSASTPQIRASADALSHDAYIWQRAWTPQLVSAAHRSSDLVRVWRILLAEADRYGRWTTIAIPWNDILATKQPIIAVIRIDGRLDEERAPAILDRIVASIDLASTAIASSRPGRALTGIEVDYDCPTSKLPAYARFLAELRSRLKPLITISITALPTWMSSIELERLTTTVDEIVLQVHAVSEPRRGLFNPSQAELWVQEFGRRSRRPFRVALPTYDVRVSWRGDGRLASVEGEYPLLFATPDSQLLGASPEAVSRFLRWLERSAPDGVIGVAWFRLPTSMDTRSWSLSTWRAVIVGILPAAKVSAQLVPTERSTLWEVTLFNSGPVDAAIPRLVQLDATCELADGANGFRLTAESVRSNRPLILEATGSGRLRANRRRVIGWAQCTQPRRELHVVR